MIEIIFECIGGKHLFVDWIGYDVLQAVKEL